MMMNKSFREALPQVLAVSVKNIVLIGKVFNKFKKILKFNKIKLGFGQCLGFPTILIPALQTVQINDSDSDLMLNKVQISWISSLNLICVPLGCVFSGTFATLIGRRKAMQLVNIPIFISWIIFFYSKHVYHLYIALSISGFTGKMK
jgi:MFS family permease